MKLKKWEDLPENMQNDAVKKYYDILQSRSLSLVMKRIFDIVISLIMLIILFPVFIILAVAIKIDSNGPVFYRQVRITSYGKEFKIHKFRTMVNGADKKGPLVTVDNDSRVTRMGKLLRGCRLDELPQLIDVLVGDMTFVGVRPEVSKYVEKYTPEMMATLLMPAGITNLSSIYFKDEAELMKDASDADKTYTEEVLPKKMYYNLKGMENFGILSDIKIMFMTVFAVLGKEYKEENNTEGD